MFKKTEEKGKFHDDFYVDFSYVNNPYGFPTDGEKVRTAVSGVITSTEESWKYEEIDP